jgi:hypothetical protein
MLSPCWSRVHLRGKGSVKACHTRWRVACFGGSPVATGNPEPAPPKHVELSATRVLRAMSYGFIMLSPCWSTVHLRGKGSVKACHTWRRVACFGRFRVATGSPQPAPPKHVELSATGVLRAMSYGLRLVPWLVTHFREAPLRWVAMSMAVSEETCQSLALKNGQLMVAFAVPVAGPPAAVSDSHDHCVIGIQHSIDQEIRKSSRLDPAIVRPVFGPSVRVVGDLLHGACDRFR